MSAWWSLNRFSENYSIFMFFLINETKRIEQSSRWLKEIRWTTKREETETERHAKQIEKVKYKRREMLFQTFSRKKEQVEISHRKEVFVSTFNEQITFYFLNCLIYLYVVISLSIQFFRELLALNVCAIDFILIVSFAWHSGGGLIVQRAGCEGFFLKLSSRMCVLLVIVTCSLNI